MLKMSFINENYLLNVMIKNNES